MNDRIILNPQQSIIKVVAENLISDKYDLSTKLVVFSGKRPAHFLRKELSSIIGCSYIPPNIFSLDNFIKLLFQKNAQKIEISDIEAIYCLYQVHISLKEKIGGDNFSDFESFMSIGFKLFNELEELHIACIKEETITEHLQTLNYNRLYLLPQYYKKFYDLLKTNNYATRAVFYNEVANKICEIDLSEYSKIIFAGISTLTNSEKIIFKELEKRDNVLFINQSDKLECDNILPEINLYEAQDTHGQIFSLSHHIKESQNKGVKLDENTVIVLPTSNSLFPLLHQTLSLVDSDLYNIALGYPIVRTPLYGFILNLLELICSLKEGKYLAKHYINFVLHPYVKNIYLSKRSDVTRIMFHNFELFFAKNQSCKYATLEEIENNDDVISKTLDSLNDTEDKISIDLIKEHLLVIHNNTVRVLGDVSSIQDFATKLIKVITYIYENSTARLHPLFYPYADSFLKIFYDLENSILKDMRLKTIESYFAFIKNYLSMQNVPFSGTPLKGLQVLGMLETRNLKFDNVYLLNANDSIIPGSGDSDMLLPQQLRMKLGMETRNSKDKLNEYYFNLLVNGAKNVYIYYSESKDDSKSRFIDKIMWQEQKKAINLNVIPINKIQYNINLSNDNVNPIEKTDEIISKLRGFEYSPTSLDDYLKCQIKFYYKYLLQIKEKDNNNEDITRADIGSIIHQVLHAYFNPLLNKKLEESDIDVSHMKILVDKYFCERYGEQYNLSLYLVKNQIVKQLEKFLYNYQKPLISSYSIKVLALEKDFKCFENGYKFKGTIDRIEQRNNNIFIIDYKSGANKNINFAKILDCSVNERKLWYKQIKSVQLAIYLKLVKSNMEKLDKEIIPAYLYLGENTIHEKSEKVFCKDSNERQACYDASTKIVNILLEELNDINKPFMPTCDISQNCQYCPYKNLCGTQWVKDKKY